MGVNFCKDLTANEAYLFFADLEASPGMEHEQAFGYLMISLIGFGHVMLPVC